MFECKYPLLEVIQAIEKIRKSKGPTEMEVLDYVRKHVRKPDDPVKVLKIISTLKKLVEEGVLVQKGKRYMFSPNPPESSGAEDCEEEEDKCGGDKEDDCGDDDKDDDCGDDDKDDDCDDDKDDKKCEGKCDIDDDDDDDSEEEESDDDSSDECNEKDIELNCDNNQEPIEGGEENKIKTVLKNKNYKRPSRSPENLVKNLSSANAEMSKYGKSAQEEKTGSCKTIIKGNKPNNVLDQKSGDGKNKGGEAIAFCTRDFIDSQYRPQSHSSCEIQPSKSEEMPQDSLSPRSEKLALGSMFSRGKRTSRMKRGQMSESDYRSRSPIRGMRPEMFDSMRLDHQDEMGSISSQLFQEQADAEMDVDGRKDGEAGGVEYDVYRHRSPLGPPPPNTPGVHVSREESCCSNFEGKNQNEIKLEPNFEEFSLKKNIQGEVSQMKCKDNLNKRGGEGEKRPENTHKRGMSSDDEKNMSDDARASLCSICEKKKRNS